MNNEEIKNDIEMDNKVMDEFIKNIQSKCPVNILNPNITQHPKSSLIGMYLMCLSPDDINNKVSEYSITTDLLDESILFFDRHHIVELCAIFYGAIQFLMDKNNDPNRDNSNFINMVSSIASYISIPHTYNDLKNFMSSSISNISKNSPGIDPRIFARLKAISNKIWFVPYNKLDAIAMEAKELYDNETKSGDKNE